MRDFLLAVSLLLAHSSLSAGIFSWTDSSGNIVYGDSPPDTAVAKAVAPPKLTILENFGNRYEDQTKPSSRINFSLPNKQPSKSVGSASSKKIDNPYKAVSIIAPKANQSIRANDGDVSIMASTSPKLRADDKLLIYLNGQVVASGKSRVANLSNLDRGEYQLLLEIQNSQGQSLIKSSQINFNVLRNSVINNKQKPYSPYDDDPSQ